MHVETHTYTHQQGKPLCFVEWGFKGPPQTIKTIAIVFVIAFYIESKALLLKFVHILDAILEGIN